MKLVTSCLASLLAAAPSGKETFDGPRNGATPAGWSCGTTGNGKPQWSVLVDPSAPTPPNVLRQGGHADFPWCVLPDAKLVDGHVEVRLKTVSGEEDQAGGVIWRWKDSRNYYIARANALEQNVTLFRVTEGRRRSVKNTDLPVAANTWHTLRVEFAGRRASVFFDGKRVLDAEDDSLTGEGGVGVWTKADSVTLFDDFSFGPKK